MFVSIKIAGGTSKSCARRKYYECVGKRNHVCGLPVLDKESIETAVIQKIFDFLSDKANINHVFQQLISFDSKRTPEMERMQKVIDETDNKIKNYMVSLESGVNIDIAVNRLKELQDIKKKQEIEFKNQSVLNRTYTVDEYKEFFKNWLNIKKLDDESKQYLINMFIEKVFIYKDKTIKIIFRFIDKSVQLASSVGVPQEERSVHQNDLDIEYFRCFFVDFFGCFDFGEASSFMDLEPQSKNNLSSDFVRDFSLGIAIYSFFATLKQVWYSDENQISQKMIIAIKIQKKKKNDQRIFNLRFKI